MEGDFITINKWLMPLSRLYGLGVRLRNFLFDAGFRKSRAFRTPIISVGNLTVGGTGKTPHVEYLVRLLKDQYRVAVLSRGYKRKSFGFVMADEQTPQRAIGDEPYQMKQKFPDITVAVDKKRAHGIAKLTNNDSDESPIDVILLDDAFQHRQVKPGINMLLVDYHRLIVYDKLLPAGRLREPLEGKDRADIVIITKCPKDLKPVEYRVITKAMNLYPFQSLYFSTLDYDSLQRVFTMMTIPESLKGLHTIDNLQAFHVLLITGIASPRQLKEDLATHAKSIQQMAFSDHHEFNSVDICRINRTFEEMAAPKCIITTEKDATRLTTAIELSEEVRSHLYALPIRISFMLDQEETFNQSIIDYVRKHSRNSILDPVKDDLKPQDGHHPGDRTRPISFRNH
jgi:tetraacyldisaccharide 4'-kinase